MVCLKTTNEKHINMKKRNPSNKLSFDKIAITELNDSQILEINGGTDSLRSIPITIYILTLL